MCACVCLRVRVCMCACARRGHWVVQHGRTGVCVRVTEDTGKGAADSEIGLNGRWNERANTILCFLSLTNEQMQRASTPNRHCGLSQRISLYSPSNPGGPRPAIVTLHAQFQLVLAPVVPVAERRGVLFQGNIFGYLLEDEVKARAISPWISDAVSRWQWGCLLVGAGPLWMPGMMSSPPGRILLPSYISLSSHVCRGNNGSKWCRERLDGLGWNTALVCHLICV